MKRSEYIENRKAALTALNTEDLAIRIGEYFDTHATLPGQKDLKDAAERIIANIAENPDFEIPAETKEEIVNSFAEMVVREMKVEKLQVMNVTKENVADFAVLKATDLGLVMAEEVPAQDKKPAKKIYTADARIDNGKVIVGDYEIGSLSDGFIKNNPGLQCEATVVATDYSNGKFRNMSYSVVADIAA